MGRRIEYPGTVGKIDKVIYYILRVFSYIGVAAAVIMSVLSVSDIIAAKVFSKAIPNQYEFVQYLLIAVVYCFLPIITNHTGLMSVDILTRKFSALLLRIIDIFAYILGTGIFAFITWQGFVLLQKHMREMTASSSSSNAFQIWPFTVLYVVGLGILTLSCLWRVIRDFCVPLSFNIKKEEKETLEVATVEEGGNQDES